MQTVNPSILGRLTSRITKSGRSFLNFRTELFSKSLFRGFFLEEWDEKLQKETYVPVDSLFIWSTISYHACSISKPRRDSVNNEVLGPVCFDGFVKSPQCPLIVIPADPGSSPGGIHS